MESEPSSRRRGIGTHRRPRDRHAGSSLQSDAPGPAVLRAPAAAYARRAARCFPLVPPSNPPEATRWRARSHVGCNCRIAPAQAELFDASADKHSKPPLRHLQLADVALPHGAPAGGKDLSSVVTRPCADQPRFDTACRRVHDFDRQRLEQGLDFPRRWQGMSLQRPGAVLRHAVQFH